MNHIEGVHLSDVQAVYSGPEGELWELIMGEQVHIGGMTSSMDLADKAGIAAGTQGVDLCCCTGGGMRFLVLMRKVARMRGVDATPTVIARGRARNEKAGLQDKIEFVEANVCQTGLPAGAADFVWGEDAWCYVEDKFALAREAARIVRSGGTVAFTDWVEGKTPLTAEEARRLLKFMKFPTLASLQDWRELLSAAGLRVQRAENTGRFAPHVDLYLEMIQKQFTFDALRIIGFDQAMLQMLAGEMAFMQQLAHNGKIVQGLFVAQKD
ncbi:MAG: methyltransferase domain-containing protein [Planctomycetota bacterium]|nr:methyltransferase domain-containing protein [Planctomycetota bacterium]